MIHVVKLKDGKKFKRVICEHCKMLTYILCFWFDAESEEANFLSSSQKDKMGGEPVEMAINLNGKTELFIVRMGYAKHRKNKGSRSICEMTFKAPTVSEALEIYRQAVEKEITAPLFKEKTDGQIAQKINGNRRTMVKEWHLGSGHSNWDKYDMFKLAVKKIKRFAIRAERARDKMDLINARYIGRSNRKKKNRGLGN